MGRAHQPQRGSYDLTETPDGTRVVETRRTPRGETRFALWFTRRLLGGQRAHDDELERGMQSGLERIAALATTDQRAAATS